MQKHTAKKPIKFEAYKKPATRKGRPKKVVTPEPLPAPPAPVPPPPAPIKIKIPREQPEPKPEPKKNEYTMEDWQKEVAQHCPPGTPIPDWLSAKCPS